MMVTPERMEQLRREPAYRALVELLRRRPDDQFARFTEQHEQERQNEPETDSDR